MRNGTRWTWAGVALATHLYAGQVLADEPLEEVVITAQKRAQNLQDVPVAVDAFSGAALQDSGVRQPLDLASLTPNLSAKNAVGNTAPIFALRGIGLNDFATNGTQPVGVYVDEVYLANNSQLGFQTMDMERVEVLKGPQGTLYGRNTTAGAINFITKKPTETFDAGVNITGGEWELLAGDAYINGRIADNLSGRFSIGGERQFEGFFVNDLNGDHWGQSRRVGWRGQLLWEQDATHILFNLHGGLDKSDNWYYKFLDQAVPNQSPVSTQLGILAAQQNPDMFHGTHTLSPPPFIDNLSNGLTVSVDHEFEAVTLKSITAVENLEYSRSEDYGGLPVQDGWNRYAGHLTQYSEEFRLASSGERRWGWIVGAFVGRDRLHENDLYDELFNSVYYTYVFDEKYIQTTTNAAVFSHNEIKLSQDLRLTIGLRYTDEEKHHQGGTIPEPGDHSANAVFPDGSVCVPSCVVDTVLHYHEPTGKLGLDYRFGNAMVYGSASRGYKSGGVTGFFVTDVGAKAAYKPEFINAYELGVKSNWLGNKLRLNGALFYYDYKDLQAFGVEPNAENVPEFRIFNIAKSRVDGLELESSWLPFGGLRWDLGLGLLNTKVLQSDVLTTAASGVNVGIVGNRLGNAPNLELDSSLSYHWLLSGSLMASADMDLSWRGGTFYYVQGDPRQFVPAYVLLNPRVTLGLPAETWKLTFWVKNATNKHYYREIFNDGNSVVGFPAAPRQVGATFSYRWQ